MAYYFTDWDRKRSKAALRTPIDRTQYVTPKQEELIAKMTAELGIKLMKPPATQYEASRVIRTLWKKKQRKRQSDWAKQDAGLA